MSRIFIRLTKTAADKARDRAAVEKAAAAAYEAAGKGDIHFLAFKANGQQFALSSRSVLDVEWLPNRVPPRVLRPGSGQTATGRSRR